MAELPEHPGVVTFIDGEDPEDIEEVPVAQLAERDCYAETESGLVPVVAVVTTDCGDHLEIREYSADQELVRFTTEWPDDGDAPLDGEGEGSG